MLRAVKIQQHARRGVRALSTSSSSSSGGNGLGKVFAAIVVMDTAFGMGVYYSEHNPHTNFAKSFQASSDSIGLTPYSRQILKALGLARNDNQNKNDTLAPPQSAASNSEIKAIDNEVKKNKDALSNSINEAHQKTTEAEKKAENDLRLAKESQEAHEKAEAAKLAALKEGAIAKEQERLAREERAKADALLALEKEAEAQAAAIDAEKNGEVIPDPTAVTPVMSSHTYVKLPIVSSEQFTPTLLSTSSINSGTTDGILSDINKQSSDLKKELESTLLSDLHELDENALRTRVTQLAAEFFERTKWEGVRVYQSIQQVEADITKKYDELLRQQRVELELEANKMLLSREQQVIAKAFTEAQEQVTSHEKHYAATLRKIENEFKNDIATALTKQAMEITDDLQDKLNNEVANIRNEEVQKQLNIQAKISSLDAEIAAFHEATEKISGLNETSSNAHKFSAAILNLQLALQTSNSILNEVKAVKKYSDSDPLVDAIVESLPADLVESGAPHVEELKLRFNVLRDELRKVAMAPEGMPPVVGQAIGGILAKFYWQPSGPVNGDGAEEILSRANYTLNSNDLNNTLKELDNISDPISKSLMSDWRKKANNRMSAEAAVKALQAQAIVKHLSLASSTKK